MTEPICKTCKHEGTDKTPFCIGGGASICHKYEIHATKKDVEGERFLMMFVLVCLILALGCFAVAVSCFVDFCDDIHVDAGVDGSVK